MIYYFLVNPVSGGGYGMKIWSRLKPRLEHSGTDYRMIRLRGRGEAKETAASLSLLQHDYTAIIIGGDGTVNEFLNGITDFSHLTLGCIPTGTGNDFVRGLGLPADPSKALAAILAPQEIRTMKLGAVCAGGCRHVFSVSCGIGFDAEVCRGACSSPARALLNRLRIGKIVYLLTALPLLLSMKQHRMQLTLDGKKQLRFGRVFFAAVMNLPYEGGGFMFAPQADPEQASFVLCIAENLTRLRTLRLLPLALSGRHAGQKGAHLLSCRRLEIRSAQPLCLHTDGEILGSYDRATLEALPAGLHVIVR